MATADAEFGGRDSLVQLAARLAPGVMAEAVAEARDRARGEIARLLAREITAAACGREATIATWPRPPDGQAPRTERQTPSAERETRPRQDRDMPRGEDGDKPRARKERDARDHPVPASDHPVPASHDAPELGVRHGPPTGGVEEKALYTYGIVPAGTDVTGLPGLAEGTAVRAISRGSVALAVSVIDPAVLCDIEEDLSETGRLASLARGHDQVLRELQDRAAVLPLRFGTVLAGEREAAGVLEDPDSELPRALDALRGAREWGFRIDAEGTSGTGLDGVTRSDTADGPSWGDTAGGTAPDDAAGGTAPGGAAGPGTGAAYLTARRDELRAEEQRREETSRLVERAHRELLAHARDGARRPGRPDRIFDCAYLVDRDEEEQFLDAADRLGPLLENVGHATAVTGPWPPYSFVDLTLGEDRPACRDATAGPGPPGAAGRPADVTRSDRCSVPYGDRRGDSPRHETGHETGEERD